ncbi:MAG: hypothetical protein ACHQD9_00285 [Chitinophagales bacterium]
MKKLCFLVFTSSVTLAQCLYAQTENRNSVSAGYGVLTVQDVATFVTDIIISPVTLDAVSVTNIRSSGVMFIEYSHFFDSHWRIVANANYSVLKSDFVYASDQSSYGTGTDQYSTLMAGVNYHWFIHPTVELYSGVQIGGSYVHSKQTYTTGDNATNNSFAFAFQVTPIGVRFGKAFGGFTELGIGYKGLICAGVDYRF